MRLNYFKDDDPVTALRRPAHVSGDFSEEPPLTQKWEKITDLGGGDFRVTQATYILHT